MDKDTPYLDCLLVVPVIGIIIVTPLFRRLLWGIEPSGYLQNKYIYMSLMWFFILLICAKGRYVKKFLENTVLLQRTSDISYEIYLFHFLILNYIVQHFNVNTVVRAIFTITITVLVALIWENIRKIVQNKMNDKFIMVIVILCFILITFLSLAKGRNTPSEISHAENMEAEETGVSESWENRLYVPTMINKIGEDYFIVDCWNHRVIYSDSLDKNIEDWKTLASDNYVGGHTVCSDGEIIVLDNTDNSQIIVYEKHSGATLVNK